MPLYSHLCRQQALAETLLAARNTQHPGVHTAPTGPYLGALQHAMPSAPSPSTARGRTPRSSGWNLRPGSVVEPCSPGPSFGQILLSIYPCLILGTEPQRMWYPLPESSDATSHHSLSLWERGMSHPEGLRLQDGGKRHTQHGCCHHSLTGWTLVRNADTYSERMQRHPPILRTVAIPMLEGLSQRTRAWKPLGTAGKGERAQHSLGSTSPEPGLP